MKWENPDILLEGVDKSCMDYKLEVFHGGIDGRR